MTEENGSVMLSEVCRVARDRADAVEASLPAPALHLVEIHDACVVVRTLVDASVVR